MIVKELFLETRFLLEDLQGSKYNSYQLIACLNIVLPMVNTALCRQNSYLVKGKETLLLEDGGTVPIPSDFNGLLTVFSNKQEVSVGDYEFIGSDILFLSPYASVDLVYNKNFYRIYSDNDTIPVPDSFSLIINKAIVSIITKTSTPLQVYSDILTDVLLMPELNQYSFIERDLPFIIN